MYQHCLRALRILNLTGVILRHLLPVMHKSGTKNILFSKTVHFLQVQVQVLYCFTAVILNSIFFVPDLCITGSKCLSITPVKFSILRALRQCRASCSVERRGQNQYEICYQPTIKGRHQLHIKVEGQHVRGSPFSLAVTLPIEKLGTPILTIGGIENPWGIAVNQRGGEVVVSDSIRNCVSVFSPSGVKLRSFGTYGSGHEQFEQPYGVAVDCEGNILVADNNNHRIQKFTVEGQFLAVVGTKGSKPLQFSSPTDITISNNKVYVADFGNHRIQVLHTFFFSTFGKEGSGKGQFNHPQGIACDSTGNLYVANSDNHRIQVFTAEGSS